MLPGWRSLSLLVCCALALLACKKPETGAELFASSCARCHGNDGAGGVSVGTGPASRNFRDHAFQTSRTDEQIKQTIVNGKGTAMPPFGPMFTDAQLALLVGHVRTLDPAR